MGCRFGLLLLFLGRGFFVFVVFFVVRILDGFGFVGFGLLFGFWSLGV